MRIGSDQTSPRLLMLSHCVPDGGGDADRARVWQLLRLGSASHQVHLVCLHDQPVNLRQWRVLNSHTGGVVIEVAHLPRRALGRLRSVLSGPAGQGAAIGKALEDTAEAWSRDRPFDAVLCTHPSLWRYARTVPARIRLCDVHPLASVWHGHRAPNDAKRANGRRWWHEYQDQRCDRLRRQVAEQCDVVTVGRASDRLKFAAISCRTVVLPEGIDLECFSPLIPDCPIDHVSRATPKLVLHGNWRHEPVRMLHRWFTKRIWPVVSKMVPNAQLQRSGPGPWPQTLAVLTGAAVIVVISSEPVLGRWPLLQGMAMARPVIAPPAVTGELGIQHPDHLLTPSDDSEWVRCCVQSLRSTSMRRQIAQAGRRFIERHCTLEATGGELVAALQQHAEHVVPVAQAA